MWSILKSALVPGSPMLLLLGVIVGAMLLLFQATRAWGRRWVLALALGNWALSTPVIANVLATAVAAGAVPVGAGQAADAAAIVVLDGGARRYVRGRFTLDVALPPTAHRALEAARVYTLLPSPFVIVTAGAAAGPASEGQALVDALVRSGVPRERIVLDSASSDTRAHAVNVARILRERGIARFVLVTSATHMRRSVLAFRREGLEPIPSAADTGSDDARLPRWRQWLPSLESLRVSHEACYDALGLAYYWVRGWV